MQIDVEALIARVVAETVPATMERVEADRTKTAGRLGYTEPEAAALLGLAPHVLRDCRLRGEIVARKAGKRFVYSRDSLLRFLGEAKPR